MAALLLSKGANPSAENNEEVISKGGYHVETSKNLMEDAVGTTIYCNEKTEDIATEISQRLVTALGIASSLLENEFLTRFDVIVWLSK